MTSFRELLLGVLRLTFAVNIFSVNANHRAFSAFGRLLRACHPNTVGDCTTAQVQAPNVDTPLLKKHPTTGLFTLTIGGQKSSKLVNFFPIPMTALQTTTIGKDALETRFHALDNAAFFRLEAR